VIGFAESGIYDPSCSTGVLFQVYQYVAIKWEPHGEHHVLSPLPGDTVSFGFGINDEGEAVGVSGLCSNTSLPPIYPSGPHAVLWRRDGSPVDLGSLAPDALSNVATSINDLGEVVGNTVLSDGTSHPFLWTRTTGKPRDLGEFPGAVITVLPCCHTINNTGEMAGFSVDADGNLRALVWKHEAPADLNTLVPDSALYLLFATAINDLGEIAGFGVDTSSGEVHAFLASPIERRGPYARGPMKPPVLSQHAREFIGRQLHLGKPEERN
jgi:uncharacterized membrane protein